CGESVFEIIRLTDAEGLNANIQSFGYVSRSLIPQSHAKIALIPQHRYLVNVWHGLFQQSEPLGAQRGGIVGYAGDVAARVRQTVDQTGCHRIASADSD